MPAGTTFANWAGEDPNFRDIAAVKLNVNDGSVVWKYQVSKATRDELVHLL